MRLITVVFTLELASAFVPQQQKCSWKTSQPYSSLVPLQMVEDSDDPREFKCSASASAGKPPSAAMDWKKKQEGALSGGTKKHFAVISGGWEGWGASKVLCEADDVEVTLIDALPDPMGNRPFLSKTGKPVEAGTRGFWKDYPNINKKLCDELGLDETMFSLHIRIPCFICPMAWRQWRQFFGRKLSLK